MNAGRFERGRLPEPVGYFEREGLRLSGSGTWRSTLCPFHEDKNPSLSVNIGTGGFVCHACKARGGDVLDFHRLRYSLTFKEAAKQLGAWKAAA